MLGQLCLGVEFSISSTIGFELDSTVLLEVSMSMVGGLVTSVASSYKTTPTPFLVPIVNHCSRERGICICF